MSDATTGKVRPSFEGRDRIQRAYDDKAEGFELPGRNPAEPTPLDETAREQKAWASGRQAEEGLVTKSASEQRERLQRYASAVQPKPTGDGARMIAAGLMALPAAGLAAALTRGRLKRVAAGVIGGAAALPLTKRLSDSMADGAHESRIKDWKNRRAWSRNELSKLSGVRPFFRPATPQAMRAIARKHGIDWEHASFGEFVQAVLGRRVPRNDKERGRVVAAIRDGGGPAANRYESKKLKRKSITFEEALALTDFAVNVDRPIGFRRRGVPAELADAYPVNYGEAAGRNNLADNWDWDVLAPGILTPRQRILADRVVGHVTDGKGNHKLIALPRGVDISDPIFLGQVRGYLKMRRKLDPDAKIVWKSGVSEKLDKVAVQKIAAAFGYRDSFRNPDESMKIKVGDTVKLNDGVRGKVTELDSNVVIVKRPDGTTAALEG